MRDEPKDLIKQRQFLRFYYLSDPTVNAQVDLIAQESLSNCCRGYHVDEPVKNSIFSKLVEYYLIGNLYLLPETHWLEADPDRITIIISCQGPPHVTYLLNGKKEINVIHIARRQSNFEIFGRSVVNMGNDYTWTNIVGDSDPYVEICLQTALCRPLEDMPLLINETDDVGDIARWRLRLAR